MSALRSLVLLGSRPQANGFPRQGAITGRDCSHHGSRTSPGLLVRDLRLHRRTDRRNIWEVLYCHRVIQFIAHSPCQRTRICEMVSFPRYSPCFISRKSQRVLEDGREWRWDKWVNFFIANDL